MDSEYSVMLYVFQLAACQATGSVTEKQRKRRGIGTKVAKSGRGTKSRKKPTHPIMSMVQQIKVTRTFVKNAKRNMTLMNQIKVYGLDATIVVGGGTTFLLLA